MIPILEKMITVQKLRICMPLIGAQFEIARRFIQILVNTTAVVKAERVLVLAALMSVILQPLVIPSGDFKILWKTNISRSETRRFELCIGWPRSAEDLTYLILFV
jgi:hypothetical protein